MPPSAGTKRETTTPSKGRAPTPGRGTGERPRKAVHASGKARRRKVPGSQTLKSTLLPLLSIWVLAIIVLLGLLYWGAGPTSTARRVAQTVGTSSAEKKEKAAGSAPRQAASREQPPPGPSANDHKSDANQPTPPAPMQPSREGAHREVSPNRQPPKPQPEQAEPAMANLPLIAGAPSSPPPPKISPHTGPPDAARVAIVIDDFGQDLEVARKFLDIPLALTFSVLPHQKHSQEVAALAHAHGHEVILHLPMQPQGYPIKNPGKGALLTAMTSEAVRKSLQSALDVSPYFKGINNHMGSRFTEDRAAMGVFLNEVKQRGLYFLDSSTSPRSVGHSMAQELRVLAGKRDIFLDHTPTEEFVRSQIENLIRKAKIEGSAIAIGHPYEVTLRTLSRKTGRFEEEAVAVVPSGELILQSGNARLR